MLMHAQELVVQIQKIAPAYLTDQQYVGALMPSDDSHKVRRTARKMSDSWKVQE